MPAAQALAVPGRRKSRSEIPVFTDTRSRANRPVAVAIPSLEDDDDGDDEKTIVGAGGMGPLDDGPGFSADSSRYQLKVVEGADFGASAAIGSNGMLLGRGEACDFQLQDGAASRKHAKVSLRGNRLSIIDLGSGNGTKVNDAPVSTDRETTLRPGDRITIGLSVLEVVDTSSGGRSQLDDDEDAESTTVGIVPAPKPSSVVRRRKGDGSVLPPPPPMGGGSDDLREQTDASYVDDQLAEHQRASGKKTAGTVLGDRIRAMSKRQKLVILGVILFIFTAGWAKSLIQDHLAQRRVEEQRALEKAEADTMAQWERTMSEARGALRDRNPAMAIQKIEEANGILPGKARDTERLRASAELDLSAETVFNRAKSLYAAGKHEDALNALKEVNDKSTFADLVPDLRKNIEKDALEALKRDIKNLLDERRIDEAKDKIATLPSAEMAIYMDMLDEAAKMAKVEAKEAAHQAAVDAKNRKRRAANKRIAEINDAVEPVISRLDREDMVGAKKALAKLSSSGKPAHVAQKINILKKNFPTLKSEYSAGMAKYERHKLEQAADSLSKALKIWNSFGLEGDFGTKLKPKVLECLEEKGANALQRQDYMTAGKAFKEALRISRASKVAQSGMNEIMRKAKDISMQAYTERHNNPARAKQLYEQVVAMTPSDTEENKKARDRLKQLETGSY